MGLIMLKRDMTEAYDLIFNLTSCIELIWTAGLECSQSLVLCIPQIFSTRLNKEYSRYNGTEVVH